MAPRSSRFGPAAVRTSAAGIAVIGCLLAGCSSSAKPSAGGAPSSGASPAGASSAGASSAGASATSASVDSSTSAAVTSSAATTSGGGSGGNSSSFCSLAKSQQKQQSANGAALASGDPATVEKAESREIALLPAFEATAPASIHGAVATIAAADRKVYTALKAANYDFRKLSPKFATQFESPGFTSAVDAVTTYLTKVCGLSTTDPTSH